MNQNLAKRFPLFMGILLIGMGIMLFAFPLLSSGLITFMACIILFLYGMTNIIRYFATEKVNSVTHLDLVIGIITVGLSITFLLTPTARITLLGIIVAVWICFSGLMRVVRAITLMDNDNSKWVWNIVPGGICIIIGLFMVLNPLHGIIAIDHITALAFLVQGISIIISSIPLIKMHSNY